MLVERGERDTPSVRRPAAVATRGIGKDPAVTATVASLWLLLALFVVYPLAMLCARMLTDHGAFTTA